MQRRTYISFVLVLTALTTAAFGQTAVRGECIALTPTQGFGGAYNMAINVQACPPQGNNLPNIVVPVYNQSQIDTKLTDLDTKIKSLSDQAIETIKQTVSAQAIKADDVARIVKETREQIYSQLKSDMQKAVQDAVRQTIQDQIAAEVTKQLADKPKQPAPPTAVGH